MKQQIEKIRGRLFCAAGSVRIRNCEEAEDYIGQAFAALDGLAGLVAPPVTERTIAEALDSLAESNLRAAEALEKIAESSADYLERLASTVERLSDSVGRMSNRS